MFTHQAYGLNILSHFPLPELPKGGTQADIHIKKGKITPPALEATSINRQGIEAYCAVNNGEEAYLQWQRVATFLAEDGNTLIVETDTDIEPQLLNLYILSEALGLILYQRGFFLLHASAVKIGEQAIIFAGTPGAGKSTTAAAFAKAGYTVLADDMVAIDLRQFSEEFTSPVESKCPLNPPILGDFDESGSPQSWRAREAEDDDNSSSPQTWGARGAEDFENGEAADDDNSSSPQSWGARGAKLPLVYPAFPQIKIWPSAAKGLGYDLSSLPRLFPGSRKRVIRKPENFPTQPFPLTHLFFLEESDSFEISPLTGTDAFFNLSRFFPLPIQLLQGKALEQHFQQCLQLINQVNVWKIQTPKDFNALNHLIDWIEQKMESKPVQEKVCC